MLVMCFSVSWTQYKNKLSFTNCQYLVTIASTTAQATCDPGSSQLDKTHSNSTVLSSMCATCLCVAIALLTIFHYRFGGSFSIGGLGKIKKCAASATDLIRGFLESLFLWEEVAASQMPQPLRNGSCFSASSHRRICVRK